MVRTNATFVLPQSAHTRFFSIEYNDCPDPETAKSLWNQYLVGFETKAWDPAPWQVFRQATSYPGEYSEFQENFLFFHDRALYMSLSLVNGRVHDKEEFARRQAANLDWVETGFDYYREHVNTIFLFVHDAPPGVEANEEFFHDLLDLIRHDFRRVKFVLVHRDIQWGVEEKFDNIRNLDVVSIVGPILPPLRLRVEDGYPVALDDNWMDDGDVP